MFVIINVNNGGTTGKSYATERGAKGACTKLNKRFSSDATNPVYKVISRKEVIDSIKMVERTNALTGEKFMESSDTPFHCSPSSESYWCN